MKRLVLFFILQPAFSYISTAQDLTGIWRGYFITDENRQYRFEVQIDHSPKKNAFSGVTYSYLDKSFYGKSSMTGNFKRDNQNALIQEIKTLEVKMDRFSQTCIQKCLLVYTKSGREEFLEGTFTSVFEKTDSLAGVVRGDDCGGGTMYLRKVKTSDFYVEPFLRKRLGPETSLPSTVKTNTPPANNNAAKNTPVKPPPVTAQKKNPTEKNNTTTVLVKPKADTAKKADMPVQQEKSNLTIRPGIKVPDILKKRENNLVQTLTITDENVVVKIYDNGQIDNDTISVYLDNQLVLSKKKLTASALTINLKMDENNPDHELVMVAENLGDIPPNTSLMIVTAGDQRFEVRITSTEQKNAVVRFRYQKTKTPLPLP
jgi:hypothetical protein